MKFFCSRNTGLQDAVNREELLVGKKMNPDAIGAVAARRHNFRPGVISIAFLILAGVSGSGFLEDVRKEEKAKDASTEAKTNAGSLGEVRKTEQKTERRRLAEEKARIEAQKEAERQKQARIAEENARQKKQREAEKRRLAQEKERIAREEAERKKQLENERRRLAEEKERIAREEAERKKQLENERRRLAEEKERIAREEAERKKQLEDERRRLAQEQDRIARKNARQKKQLEDERRRRKILEKEKNDRIAKEKAQRQKERDEEERKHAAAASYWPVPLGMFRGIFTIALSPCDIFKAFAVPIHYFPNTGSPLKDDIAFAIGYPLFVGICLIGSSFEIVGDCVMGTLDMVSFGYLGNEYFYAGKTTPWFWQRDYKKVVTWAKE